MSKEGGSKPQPNVPVFYYNVLSKLMVITLNTQYRTVCSELEEGSVQWLSQ